MAKPSKKDESAPARKHKTDAEAALVLALKEGSTPHTELSARLDACDAIGEFADTPDVRELAVALLLRVACAEYKDAILGIDRRERVRAARILAKWF